MSAAIIQKKTYFECGDKQFSENNATETQTIEDRGENCFSVNQMASSMEKVGAIEMSQKQHHLNYKDNGQFRLHGTLTRTISTPQQDSNVTSLVRTLIGNLDNMNLHRKLERTQSEPIPQHVNTSRYKTELCRPFEEAGECKYGEKCQFAHGYHELRNLQRHPKYKTEYCRTFHSVGFCPYGPRCHFVHNADEARAMQEQQNKNCSINNCVPSFPLLTKQSQVALAHSLPLSPPLSMSTGSDRESPTGSLSLSPTSSMKCFPFIEQISPATSTFHAAFSYANTPPESPNASISPVNTPPPTVVFSALQNHTQKYIKPVLKQNKEIVQKCNKSHPKPINVNSASTTVNGDDARLPVFNRLSSAVENVSDVAL